MACRDFKQTHFSRRTALRSAALGFGALGGGLSLAQLLRAETESSRRRPPAKSCILLFQFGGPSQFETFDPKPQAPAEIRGEFGTIETRNPLLRIGEHLPKLAAVANKFSLVRSVHHDRANHNSGAYYSLTGQRPLVDLVTSNAAATDFPCPGAVIDRLRGDKPLAPSAVSLPTMIADGPFRTPGEFAGFLGKIHDPLFITQNPDDPKFTVEQLALPDGVSVENDDSWTCSSRPSRA